MHRFKEKNMKNQENRLFGMRFNKKPNVFKCDVSKRGGRRARANNEQTEEREELKKTKNKLCGTNGIQMHDGFEMSAPFYLHMFCVL